MRKVEATESSADALLEGKIASYAAELERCVGDFHSASTRIGVSAALQTSVAERVAQYEEVVRVLREVQGSGEDYKARLAGQSKEAVDALRGDPPNWRRLALADVLEALIECAGLEG